MQSSTIAPPTASRLHILEIMGNAAVGGMERYILNFLSRLPPDRFIISCVCPYESRFTAALRQAGVANVYITPITDDPTWRSIQLVTEIIGLQAVDVLHAHMPNAHVLACLAGRLTEKPVVAMIHGMDFTAFEYGITKLAGSHLIVNCQEAYVQALTLGIPSSRISLIRNGVDTERFEPAGLKCGLRNQLGLSSKTMLIGFVGRYDFEKGPDFFIYAAEYLHHRDPNLHFVMVGSGSMRDELFKMRERFHLGDCLHILDWVEDTASVYRDLDVLAYTTRSDGTSLVVLEAMACECVVAAFSIGGVYEIVENRSTGVLARHGDPEELGRNIIQLLQKPQAELVAMGRMARLRVKELFDLKDNVRRTAEVLQRAGLKKASKKMLWTGEPSAGRTAAGKESRPFR